MLLDTFHGRIDTNIDSIIIQYQTNSPTIFRPSNMSLGIYKVLYALMWKNVTGSAIEP